MKKGIRTAAWILALLLFLTAVPALFATGADGNGRVTALSRAGAESEEQTEEPTEVSAEAPTEAPDESPTETATEAPTEAPTEAATEKPTEAPTETPTEAPTEAPEMPVGKPVNRYAVTKVGDLKFRASAGTGKTDKVIETLKTPGVHVWVIRNETNSKGEEWSYVYRGGQTGYIMTRYLSLLTKEDSDAWNKAQVSPVPAFTEKDLLPTETPTAEQKEGTTETPSATPNPEPTSEPTLKPTNTPTPEPTEAPEIHDGEMINRYALTNAVELKFRAYPGGSKGKILETIPKRGTHVWLIRSDQNEAGESWSYVLYKGRVGYVMTKYLNLLTPEDSDAYNNAQVSPAPVYTEDDMLPAETPTAAPAAAPTETPAATPTAAPAEAPTEEPTAEPAATATPAPESGERTDDLTITASFDRDELMYVPDVAVLAVSIRNNSDAEIRNVQVRSDETVLLTVESIPAGETVSAEKNVWISAGGTYIFTAVYQNDSGEELVFLSPGISLTIR